jgi:hypothetical protein
METYSNFKQLALSKDGASHCLYFLNVAYADPAFTSAEDAEDPMVFMQLDIKNAFGSLCARLVLDVLSGKASRDYSCGIKVDEAFETAVHELRAYFGFFKLARACESILRFYSYDGSTIVPLGCRARLANYLKLKMVFCLVTLHLWGHLFRMFPDLRGLAYADDETTVGRLSLPLKFLQMGKT